VPNRDLGIQVLGDVAGGVVGYLAGVMNGVPDGGSADLDTNDSKDVSARLIVRPFVRMEPKSPLAGLGFALSGSGGRQTGPEALPELRTRPLDRRYFSYDAAAAADGVRIRFSPQAFYPQAFRWLRRVRAHKDADLDGHGARGDRARCLAGRRIARADR
jgi:phosphate-selective porin OprO/OprP